MCGMTTDLQKRRYMRAALDPTAWVLQQAGALAPSEPLHPLLIQLVRVSLACCFWAWWCVVGKLCEGAGP